MNPLVLSNINYGVYAVGVKFGDKASASIVSSVTEIVSSQEKLISISVTKTSHTAKSIKKDGQFTVSVLSEQTPATIIGALGLVSGEKTDKLKNVRHKILLEGLPVIKENTCCWFLCKLIKTIEVGNQYIFIGEITAGSDVAYGKPMSFNYYRDELKGTIPKECPAYQAPVQTFDKSSGESFVCNVCGYIYNDPNFSFEELEQAWTCPVCGMPKSAFVRK
ncbi:MAG: flavin reductase [Clostridia bacterium]